MVPLQHVHDILDLESSYNGDAARPYHWPISYTREGDNDERHQKSFTLMAAQLLSGPRQWSLLKLFESFHKD